MSVMNKLSHSLGRRDEAPNQELAKELATTENKTGIQEIVEGVKSGDKKTQSDCIKVLYEVGYIKPDLIAEYVDDFLELLRNRNNRLVWGSMIALATIAEIKAQELYENRDEILRAIEKGSVITIDSGIKTGSGYILTDTASDVILVQKTERRYINDPDYYYAPLHQMRQRQLCQEW